MFLKYTAFSCSFYLNISSMGPLNFVENPTFSSSTSLSLNGGTLKSITPQIYPPTHLLLQQNMKCHGGGVWEIKTTLPCLHRENVALQTFPWIAANKAGYRIWPHHVDEFVPYSLEVLQKQMTP